MATPDTQRKKRGRFAGVAAACAALLLTGCAVLPDVEWSVETGPREAARGFSAGVADFNNDGLPDLVLGRERPTGFSLWLGNGRGGWWAGSAPFTTSEVRGVAVGDLNKDGWPDVVACTRGDMMGIHVWLNQGDGTWHELQPPMVRKDMFGIVALADLNQDGLLDLVAAGESRSRRVGIKSWLGDGTGRFPVQTGLTAPGVFHDLVLRDINGDGIPDAIATPADETEQGVRCWLSDGYCQWAEVPKPILYGRFAGLAVGDVDNDGADDMVAGHRDGYGLVVARRGPSKCPVNATVRPRWDRRHKLTKTGNYWDVTLADLDGDGDNEIIASSAGDLGIEIWERQRRGYWFGWTWRRSDQNFQASLVRHYAVSNPDLNLDGRPDLLVANDNQGTNVWMQLDDTGRITWPDRGLSPGWPAAESSTSVEPAEAAPKTAAAPVAPPEPAPKPAPAPEPAAAPEKRGPPEPIDEDSGTWIPGPKVIQAKPKEARAPGTRYSERVVLVAGERREAARRPAAAWRKPAPAEAAEAKGSRKVLKAADPTEDVEARDEASDEVEIEQNNVYTTINGYPEYRIGPGDQLLVTLYLGSMTKAPKMPGAQQGAEAEGAAEKLAAYTLAAGYPEYVVGAGDVLGIIIYTGLERKTLEVRVRGNGQIFAPDISPEPMIVAQLSPSQIEGLIKGRMRHFIRNPNAEVQVLKYNSKKSSILGEIRDTMESHSGPGTYALRGLERIVDFIAAHGGPTTAADLTRVQVVGRDGSSRIVNVQKAIFEADESHNVIIRTGDMIFIPSEVAFQRFDYTVTVAGDGTVFLPKVAPDRLNVDALSPRQIETKLVENLVRREIGVSPKAEVWLAKYDSKFSTAVGEFRDKRDGRSGPGRYPLRGRTYIVDYIAEHGGYTDRAELTRVRVRDGEGNTRVLNLTDAFEGTDMSQNILLDQDYVVHIPAMTITGRKVYVLGEVSSPGLVAVAEPINLLEAITRAGYFTTDAVRKKVYVVSGDPAAPGYMIVDVDKIVRRGELGRNVQLVTNDIVYVPRRMAAQLADVITDIGRILSLTDTVRTTSEDLDELKIDPYLRTRTSDDRIRTR